jgi:hypothetical protein
LWLIINYRIEGEEFLLFNFDFYYTLDVISMGHGTLTAYIILVIYFVWFIGFFIPLIFISWKITTIKRMRSKIDIILLEIPRLRLFYTMYLLVFSIHYFSLKSVKGLLYLYSTRSYPIFQDLTVGFILIVLFLLFMKLKPYSFEKTKTY